MRRLFCFTVATILACGCSSATVQSTDLIGPGETQSPLVVQLRDDGRLFCGGYIISDKDFPEFVRQVGGRQIVIQPVEEPSFSSAVKVQSELQAAGAKNVVISTAD